VLYYHPLSTFSRRVRIVFAEKQIPHELSLVDMAARRHRERPYLSVNPYGRVPTLEEDGFVLFESTAILNYLEATRPTPPLVPADARGRALVNMHMKLCDLQLTRYAGTIIFPKRFLPKDKWNTVAIAEAKAEIEKHFAHLAARGWCSVLGYQLFRSWRRKAGIEVQSDRHDPHQLLASECGGCPDSSPHALPPPRNRTPCGSTHTPLPVTL
jgi:hypothetical protein